jgi:hypothetical protein
MKKELRLEEKTADVPEFLGRHSQCDFIIDGLNLERQQ